MSSRQLILLLQLICVAAMGADWPHRGGPYRNNKTTEIVKPWTGPLEPAWQIPLGEGYSSPTVADGRLFVHAKVQDKDEEEVMAFDAVSGKSLWRISYPHKPFESNVGNGPRSAPMIVRGRVYAYGITGILTCLEAETGKQLWQTNPLEQCAAPIMMFGASAAPLIDGDRLYLPIGAPGAGLAGLDANTGEILWKTIDEPPTSVMPVLFLPKVAGRGVVRHLVYTSTRGLIGVDMKDGSVLWEFPLSDRAIGTIPPPTVAGDMVIASSMLTGTVAIKLRDQAGKLLPEEVWRNPQVTCYFTQSLATDDSLYILHATLVPEADIGLACLDLATGKPRWEKPKIGLYQLNMLGLGDGKLLMLDDTHGDLILLDSEQNEYRELARSKACNPTIITPAIAQGRVYLRDDEKVRCFVLGETAK
jgi:outer membrane protein assembly factor BamB